MNGDADATPAVAASGEAELLTACPLCGYVLTGLPVEHNCPECGFAVDRRWEVHGGLLGARVSRKRWHIGKLGFVLFSVYVAIWVIVILLVPLPRFDRRMLMVIMTAALLLAGWVALYRPRQFIALGPAGLVIVRSRKRVRRFAWRDVGHAQYDLLRKSIAFKSGDEVVRIKVFNAFGSDISAVDTCVRAINQKVRVLDSR